ncbi:MAG: BatD family protein [Phycisphaerales bacterium]|nr:BatD family protein [Phycisphaerales bacterium]
MSCQTTRLTLVFLAICLSQLLSSADVMGQGTVMQSTTEETSYVNMPTPIVFTIKNAQDWDPPVMPQVDGLEIFRDDGAQSFSSFQINGSKITQASETSYTFMITARQPGSYVIPAFNIKVDDKTLSSIPIKLSIEKTVNEGLLSVEVSSKSDDIFLGETIELTMNILIKQFESKTYDARVDSQTMWQLISDSEWGPFSRAAQEIEASRRPLRGQRRTLMDENGQSDSYYLYTLKTDVRPRSIGPFDLSGIILRMKYPASLRRGRGFFATSRIEIDQFQPIEAVATGQEILVKPLPEQGKPADFSGAVGRYSIKTSASPINVSVGDPITLTMTITNTGDDQTDMDVVPAPPLHKIPKLDQDFRVPKETLAGVTSGRNKTFTQTIRAKKDGIDSIPPITYSFFDPQSGSYQTDDSRPIRLEVSGSETIDSSDINGNPRQTGIASTDSLHSVTGGLLANYTGSDRLLSNQGPPSDWWLVIILASPPIVCVMLAATMQGMRGHASDPTRVRSRKAARIAIERLRDSTLPDDVQVAQIVCGYVADKIGKPAAGFLRSDVHQALTTSGVEESHVIEMDKLLLHCERMHYSGDSDSARSSLKSEAISLIKSLESDGSIRRINLRDQS